MPELWAAISAFPREEAVSLARDLSANPPRSVLIRGTHRFASDAWNMLLQLAMFHGGTSTEEQLVDFTATMLVHHSQAALVAGYAFHVKQLFSDDAYDLRDYVCQVPFEQLDVLESSSHLCCASWLHKSVGDLSVQSHEEVWSSDAAEAVRQSVLDGSYRGERLGGG